MSISDRLDEIQERAKIARQVLSSGTTGSPPNVSGVDVDEAIDILAESTTDVPALVAALRAVLDLHKPRNGHGDCGHCVDPADAHWGIPWPCPTVRAVQSALGEES